MRREMQVGGVPLSDGSGVCGGGSCFFFPIIYVVLILGNFTRVVFGSVFCSNEEQGECPPSPMCN